MSIKTKLIAGAGSLALAASGIAIAAPAASAAPLGQTLISCTGTEVIASLNPALGSGDAKYAKAGLKRLGATEAASGKYNVSLTGQEDFGAPVADTTSCAVNSGIRTNNAATDSTKPNPFDNQTDGAATLSMTAGPAVGSVKIAGSAAGSASCNRDDATLLTDYPNAYPLQGKMIYKYGQLIGGKQAQNQFYVRLGTDPADTDITHITLSGIVIKGPAAGGQVDATFSFAAAYSPKKNLNLLDCTATTAAKNASLALLLIHQADGPDVGTAVDPLVVSIPAAA